MTSVLKIDGDVLVEGVQNLTLLAQETHTDAPQVCQLGFGSHGGSHGGACAICLDEIVLQETALVKGCEHSYCLNCILQWATYHENPKCPQCKHPFESLNVHRSLDGSIHDVMFEESVCLLLRATWFEPLVVEERYSIYDDPDNYYFPCEYEDEDYELDEAYFQGSSSIRIGNRRWGDNGFVSAGRQEARPAYRPNNNHNSGGAGSSSRQSKKKEAANNSTGRRAKRALKREAADKAAAEKRQGFMERVESK